MVMAGAGRPVARLVAVERLSYPVQVQLIQSTGGLVMPGAGPVGRPRDTTAGGLSWPTMEIVDTVH
jgi:antitoxin (DNA-binding transcriptional repressor) of toxin-antitoxin stability system